MAVITAWCVVCVGSAAEAQRQFATAGIELAVNKAARHPTAPQIVLSLILTNMREESVQIFIVRDQAPMIVGAGGGSARALDISGLPICGNTGWYAAGDCASFVRQGELVPVVIDGKNSITVTLTFPGAAERAQQACNIDLSMQAFIRRGAARQEQHWSQVVFGVPNINLCS